MSFIQSIWNFSEVVQIPFVNEKRKKEWLRITIFCILSGVVKFPTEYAQLIFTLIPSIHTRKNGASFLNVIFFHFAFVSFFLCIFLNVEFRICVITRETSVRDLIDLLIYSQNQMILPTALFFNIPFHIRFKLNVCSMGSTNFETHKKCDSIYKNTKLYSKKNIQSW